MTAPENKGFSDDDLKRLKDRLDDKKMILGSVFADDVKRILTRLEAAERALEKATPFFDMNPTRIGEITQTGIHVFTDAYWEWRKAAGK